jgi:hypothetical protein
MLMRFPNFYFLVPVILLPWVLNKRPSYISSHYDTSAGTLRPCLYVWFSRQTNSDYWAVNLVGYMNFMYYVRLIHVSKYSPFFLVNSNVSPPLPMNAGKSYNYWKYDPYHLRAFWSLLFHPFPLTNFPACLLGNWCEESRVYSGITGRVTKTIQNCKIL